MVGSYVAYMCRDVVKLRLRNKQNTRNILCIGTPCFYAERSLPERVYPKDGVELNTADESTVYGHAKDAKPEARVDNKCAYT